MSVLDLLARGLLAGTNLALGATSALLSRRTRAPRSLLVHRVGRLGDGAAAWHALAALREAHPAARIVLLTSVGERPGPGLAELLEGTAVVDELRSYRPSELRGARSAWRFARALASERFDVWQSLPQVGTRPWTELRNLCFARAAGARRLTGFRVDNVRWFSRALERRLPVPVRPEAQRLLGLVGGRAPVAYPLPLDVSERARALAPEPGFLALAPGATRPANRWPLDRFERLARTELERGGRVVFVGGPTEALETAQLARALDDARCTTLAGVTSVRESIAVLARARALVTNDSGLAHLGGLADVPTLVVSSARDVEGRWTPAGGSVVVLRERPTCAPCWVDTCPLDHRCLLDQTTDRVQRSLDELAPCKLGPDAGSSGSEVDMRPPLGSPIGT